MIIKTEREKLLAKAVDIIRHDCERQEKFEKRLDNLNEGAIDYYETYDFLKRTSNQYDAIIESRVSFVCRVFDVTPEQVWNLI